LDERLKNIEQFYNKHAQQYFEERTVSGGRLFNEFIEMPATKALLSDKVKKGSQLLDIGSGIGVLSHYFGSVGAEVTGIDISSEMIKISNNLCKRQKNIRFLKTSFEDSTFESNTFDFIVGSFMISYFLDLETCFEKICSYLKPSGIAVLSMLHPAKLSIAQHESGMIEKKNYFDENDYNTDLDFEDDYITLKKWSIDDVTSASEKAGLCIKCIKEPKPDLFAALNEPKATMYFAWPSVIVFKFFKH
jgi:ubiquinone/menaquinone biosynthesis C-methylase UbiE